MRHQSRLWPKLVAVLLVMTTSVGWALWNGMPPGVETPPDTAEAHLGNGYSALTQEHYEDAANEFRAALAINPKLVLRAQFPLAVALFEMHQAKDARHEFESVRRAVGDHPNILYYLGRLDLENANFNSAVKNLAKAAANPPFPDTSYYLGFAYFKAGDLGAAEKWFEEATRQVPRDSRVPYQLGKLYQKQGRKDEADRAFAKSEELRKRNANDSRVRLECAQTMDQGLREEASAICEQLYDPNDAQNLTALGTIYGQHGNFEEALKCFRRAAELEPRSPQMQYNLALVYYQLNQFENARLPLENALKEWTDLFRLNALYGAVLRKLGEGSAAHQALRRAHELNPYDSGTADLLYSVTLELAQESKSAQKFSDSLQFLQEAIKLRPGDPEPHRRLAEIYTLTARSPEAAAEWREAERLSGRSAN